MPHPTFYIVDVFAEKKYVGNQLAVFRNVQSLSDETLQQIAHEMNFSETTFILDETEKNGGYDVRIFTPNEEVPFAGHPTLGTAYILANDIIRQPIKKIVLNLKVGQIPVTIEGKTDQSEILWMKQINPIFGPTFDAQHLARILNLKLDDVDSHFPIQAVSTGLPFIIVPLKSLAAVKQAYINRDLYFDFIKNLEAKAIFIFCPETYDPQNKINARMFADCYGIVEDPATGSANGCLAGYLVKHRYFNNSEIDIRIEQGYEINRPSILYLKAKYINDMAIDIFVGGKVQMIAKGEWN
jgi:trans-2,3-dihydro-3-hydroxyanthranilate isomerase